MRLRALKVVMKSRRRGALEERRRTKVRSRATEAVRDGQYMLPPNSQSIPGLL